MTLSVLINADDKICRLFATNVAFLNYGHEYRFLSPVPYILSFGIIEGFSSFKCDIHVVIRMTISRSDHF